MSDLALTSPTTIGSLRLGSVTLDLPAVQAALSGYSDLPMRRVARAHGAPYCVHEVVLDQTVLTRGKLQRAILDVPDDDHPVGGQLMGADPVTFGRAARRLADAGYDVVDLNFGCPVPKVLGRCRGGYLVGEPETALEMVERVIDAVAGDRPVTVKMRRGIDDSLAAERAFFTILDGCFARGVAAVTVHPRTVKQRYVGPSDWAFLARVKRHAGSATLLGSGDLFSPFDVQRMLRETGVDGVTIARGCIGNPWIFRQVRELLEGRTPQAPTLAEQRSAILWHWAESVAHHGPDRGAARARTHAIKYAALHPNAERVREAFVAIRGERDLHAVLETHYPPERDAERAADLEGAARRAQSLRGCGVAGGAAAQAGCAGTGS